jgi:hypothetical protein
MPVMFSLLELWSLPHLLYVMRSCWTTPYREWHVQCRMHDVMLFFQAWDWRFETGFVNCQLSSLNTLNHTQPIFSPVVQTTRSKKCRKIVRCSSQLRRVFQLPTWNQTTAYSGLKVLLFQMFQTNPHMFWGWLGEVCEHRCLFHASSLACFPTTGLGWGDKSRKEDNVSMPTLPCILHVGGLAGSSPTTQRYLGHWAGISDGRQSPGFLK